MARILDTAEFLDTVCELLQQGQTHVSIPVAGGSMLPFLRNGDTVCLDLVEGPVKRGDILLYRRLSGRYILHRVYKVCRDGSFLMVGDAQQELEHLPSRDQICARVTMAWHKDRRCGPKTLRWWFYAHAWLWVLPMRRKLLDFAIRLKYGKKR